MACQIKVSVKVVKRGVDTVQVPSSDPALYNALLQLAREVVNKTRKAGRYTGSLPPLCVVQKNKST